MGVQHSTSEKASILGLQGRELFTVELFLINIASFISSSDAESKNLLEFDFPKFCPTIRAQGVCALARITKVELISLKKAMTDVTRPSCCFLGKDLKGTEEQAGQLSALGCCISFLPSFLSVLVI